MTIAFVVARRSTSSVGSELVRGSKGDVVKLDINQLMLKNQGIMKE